MQSQGLSVVQRVSSVDLLRGLVMIIMALDHVRDFTTAAGFSPTDLEQTTAGYFFTRWITHFCAPVFILLAGTSAFLWENLKNKTKKEVSWLLFTRGLWLILVEVYIINPIYNFEFQLLPVFLQVIWAIGVSMVIMSALVYLRLKWIIAISLVVILLHNAFDGVSVEGEGPWVWTWLILHQPGSITLDGAFITYIAYPLVPWFGVMGLGYGLGRVFLMEAKDRRKILLKLGFGLTGLFIVLRAFNIYGDPVPWTVQENWLFTVLSFLNTTKYPVSLQFLCMTLGPSLLFLAWFEKAKGKVVEIISLYGKVPFFYYILHFFLAHVSAFVIGYFQGFDLSHFVNPDWEFPEGYGVGLGGTYVAFVIVVVMTYFPCKWYAGLKRRSGNPLLTYL